MLLYHIVACNEFSTVYRGINDISDSDSDLIVKVKKTYVIRCRLLYCTLVPGMMSVSVIVCEI